MSSCDSFTQPDVASKASALICGDAGNPCKSETTCPSGMDAECLSASNPTKGDTSCAASAKCINNQCQYVSAASDALNPCRPPTDTCDKPELCDPTFGGMTPTTVVGPWQCPTTDAIYKAADNHVCRADNGGGCDVAETCTGSGKACPADVGKGTAFVCRAAAAGAAGACDVAEKCGATSAPCPTDAFVAVNTECRAANGICDVHEVCTGSSAACPADGFIPAAAGQVCRAVAGVCDVAETCSGSSAACPTDVLVTAGSMTVCRAANGACDVAEMCNGSSSACPTDGFVGINTECRASAGACDPHEVCSGSSGACPADSFRASGFVCALKGGVCQTDGTCDGSKTSICSAQTFLTTVCRASNGICDVAESCTGASATCPNDGFVSAASATVCRAANGICDAAETCSGSSAACPADAFITAASNTQCRAANGICDVAEKCSGTAATCPADAFVTAASNTTCRASQGVCDIVEKCTGSSAACPADGAQANGFACAPKTGLCETDGVCNGSPTSTCSAKTFLGSSTQCRAANGICDVAENCTGSTAACPTDAFVTLASNTTCRAANGVCDAAEICSGTAATCPADTTMPNTTVCRASQGICDPQETCIGGAATATTRACPAEVIRGNGFVCDPAAGTCQTDGTCNGTATSPCSAKTIKNNMTVCRVAGGGGCDADDKCDGINPACPADGFQPINTVCRAQNGACDVQEVCPGNSATCPADGTATAGTICRASQGVCDPQEVCVGGAATATTRACPAEVIRGNGFVCAAAGGICENAGTCDGSATSICSAKSFKSSATACRASAGACDIVENCTGSAAACPTDAFVTAASNTTCRASNGPCDVVELCPGGTAACPTDTFITAASNTTCRASNGPCDIVEKCAGGTAACPTDTFFTAASNTTCRASAGACDAAETCAGGTAACPPDVLRGPGVVCNPKGGPCETDGTCDGTSATNCSAKTFLTTVCRAANGTCDVAETCTGAAAACPGDVFKDNTNVCRVANGACDVAESCTGSTAACPTDAFIPAVSNTICRAALGVCDVAEKCTGASGACPTDSLQPSSFTCRNDSGNGCDVAEKCTGSAVDCPADGFKAISTVCRAKNGACDIAETCSGASDTCPGDGFQPSSFSCRPPVGGCDVEEFCTGSAGACPTDVVSPNTTVCRAATGICDIAEKCDGATGSCPADALKPNGSSCDDANVCNGVAKCQTGSCVPGAAPDCDDKNPCTVDGCDASGGCTHDKTTMNGMPCSDGKYCTVGDTCGAGVCGGIAKDCGTPAEACLISVCDEASSSCVLKPNPDGTQCKDDSTKPYMMVIVDNSASMSTPNGAGNNSCGVPKSRLSDAKCVLTNIVNSYGDVVFGLERFRETPKPGATPTGGAGNCGTGVCLTGSSCPSGCNACDDTYSDCTSCDTATGLGCPPEGNTAASGEVLAPIIDHQQDKILRWIDNKVDTCANDGTGDPELAAHSSTPIAGSLRTAQQYFQGSDPTYPGQVIDTKNACRPYYVILLTDGNEGCTQFSNTLAAADALRHTVVGTATYDIKTYVIEVGFGKTDPSGIAASQIAAAGGTGSAYFATDEQTLSLAFADILKKSVLVEICNGKDDNCNGLIDEGFTHYCDLKTGHLTSDLCDDPGDPCDGTDDNCFAGITDEVQNACGTCGTAPAEICDKLDNNCDGFVDEGLDCSCFVQPEICDGKDNDCDNVIDNGLTRPCGAEVGECHVGVETCVMGVWQGCTATNGMPEICNKLDDNCDGTIDGISQQCGTSNVGACQFGTQLCVDGAFGACTGNVEPTPEVCDKIDNNCNGTVDEGNPGGGAPCSTACGPGTVQCNSNGKLVCVADNSMTIPEVCNGVDDNCNGEIDEGLDNLGPCDNNGKLCVPGILKCLKGTEQCVGGDPPKPEVCDCKDNDCNDQIDEGDLCGSGGKCLAQPYCACAFPCGTGEFPCPSGFRCDTIASGDRFCVSDPCANVTCPNVDGGIQICVEGKCQGICDTISCDQGDVCRPKDGQCVKDNCINFPSKCAANEQCIGAVCVADPCQGVTCNDGQFCRAGTCVDSCATVYCQGAERCHDGACIADPCATLHCDDPTVCVVKGMSAACVDNPCVDRLPICAPGLVCNPANNMCEPNPCDGVKCPMGQVCGGQNGDCFLPNGLPDIAVNPESYIAAVGGGGAGCSAIGASTATLADALAMLLALLGLYLMPKRKPAKAKRGGSR